ncbi:helix-turn-helix transcriptional regulator [uncultured Oscillibacter sp.]|uniref:helix-turn-helix domain-containing protein n=1 Tax=uncultured Oscillibacter sp. TaxID=876091 RepID=UPI0025F895EF|nr:helix-turn-helix transcriptional regulator [uncultured Oscillibacter sp.]
MDISANNYADIRSRIFEALEESGMSQKEFALRMNVAPQTVTDWKKGKSASFVRMGTMLSMVLNVSPAWLVFGEGEKYLSKEENLKLLKSQINYDVSMLRDTIEVFTKANPGFSFLGLMVAAAYDQADKGTQAAVRKLLDVNEVPQESGRTSEAM